MPITIRNLIDGRPQPVTIAADATVQDALELMSRHDFSQLPVIDARGAIQGLITSDSIVRALSAFQVTSAELRVHSAMRLADTYDPDDDIADLLDTLRDTYAAVVAGANGELMAVVTGFDIAEHFRKQFEDLMLVQDIETAIKEWIQFVLRSRNMSAEQAQAWVHSVVVSEDRNRKSLEAAIRLYAAGQQGAELDISRLSVVLDGSRVKPKDFERLTLGEYIALVLHDECWPFLSDVHGNMPKEGMRTLLNKVRESRNALAHFRGELSPTQRSEIRVCADWFEQHRIPEAPVGAPPPQPAAPPEAATLIPADEPSSPSEGRYIRLAEQLVSQMPGVDQVTFTFDEVEVIIHGQLPKSAFAHRSWWANDSVSHPQSRSWLDAGWRVANLSLTNRLVTFSRIEGRQGAYIAFYGAALSALRSHVSWGVAGQSPNGANWQLLAGLASNGRQLGILAWAFARGRRFRTEVYIDSRDRALNKRLFDALYADRQAIEAELGRELAWERMNERQASRVALYRDGSVQDSSPRLAELSGWAVSTAGMMHDCLFERVRSLRIDTVEHS
jgi:CBS domain-containing protein